MFRKSFKIKSNSQVKGSERKTIKESIFKSFPNLTEADVEQLLPKKEILSTVKLLTANNETVQVYTIQKRPMFFDIRGSLFPTIYLLWKLPNLIPVFTTHSQVLSFITSGADLMLPGVLNLKHNNLNQGSIAYVNLANNRAAVAVGITAQSSSEMLSSGGRGKCLTIYHSIGDKLCSLEGPNLPIVDLGAPEWLQLKSYEEDFPELGKAVNSSETVEEETKTEDLPQESVDEDPLDDMDEVLFYSFFVAIKYSKTLTLPILTSNFYKLQMIPACLEGKSLDIKKSSFKKLKPFLDTMCKEGLIEVKEMKKGVESITYVNKDHPRFCEFYVDPSNRPRKEGEGNVPSTSIMESYIITPNVLPIFEESGLSKGDTVQLSQIRKHVVDFIKKNQCDSEGNKRFIQPRGALVKICKTENNITWEELMEKVCASMKSCYKVSNGAEETVNKGKVSPITLTISQRSGNKKVTLIDNLELFGIHLPEFAKECQHGVAASTSISRPPGKKCEQILVQGNQILFIHNLLTEKYKIPLKYIKGLEYAPKKKK